MPRITPNLWSRITAVTHYGDAGPRPAGMVLTVGGPRTRDGR